jgi:hypothetical protein
LDAGRSRAFAPTAARQITFYFPVCAGRGKTQETALFSSGIQELAPPALAAQLGCAVAATPANEIFRFNWPLLL